MDLDEMLRVDRCRDMDELIIVRMPVPDCFLSYHISAGMPNFTSGKSHLYELVRPASAATPGI